MRQVKPADLLNDLMAWVTADAAVVEGVRRLRGGGGWEQWSVLQFLRWQIPHRGQGDDLDYHREFPVPGIPRRFDIAYNCVTVQLDVDPNYPVILTQWKCGNDGNGVAYEVNKDLGTLVEIKRPGGEQAWKPLIVVLCPEPVPFAGCIHLPPYQTRACGCMCRQTRPGSSTERCKCGSGVDRALPATRRCATRIRHKWRARS